MWREKPGFGPQGWQIPDTRVARNLAWGRWEQLELTDAKRLRKMG